MAITTLDGVINGLSVGCRTVVAKASQTAEGAGTFHSLMKAAGNPPAFGSNPATGVGAIPTKADTWTFNFPDPTGGNKSYIGRVNMQGPTAGTLIIYDRLWHNSGLVGSVATAQTVNSTALTRYTDGIGVEIWAEFYTAIGATATTFTVNYTDANNSAQTATYAHPANAESVGQMVYFVPAAGAVGCKSIQSITLAATTGTAGNFGLVMLRRLAEIPLTIANVATVADAFSLGLPELQTNAAVSLMVACTTTNTGQILGAIDFIEG